MTETRDFHLGDIQSVTTSRLVSPRHMDGIYDILGYMTGEDLFTHQLSRAARECEGPLLAQHPDLAAVEVPEDFGGAAGVDAWLAKQVARFWETRRVAPLHEDDHTHIDPFTEMRKVAPNAETMPVIIPEED